MVLRARYRSEVRLDSSRNDIRHDSVTADGGGKRRDNRCCRCRFIVLLTLSSP